MDIMTIDWYEKIVSSTFHVALVAMMGLSFWPERPRVPEGLPGPKRAFCVLHSRLDRATALSAETQESIITHHIHHFQSHLKASCVSDIRKPWPSAPTEPVHEANICVDDEPIVARGGTSRAEEARIGADLGQPHSAILETGSHFMKRARPSLTS